MWRWLVVVGALLAGCDANAPIDPDDPTPFVLEVPRGATPASLGRLLRTAGLIESDLQWRWFRWTGPDASCIKAGKFELRRTMSVTEVVDVLCGPPLADDVSFAVIEGWRIQDIDRALADRGLIVAGAYA